MKYVIITPVYNEEKYLKRYINSIIQQNIRLEKLILVDDNSNDGSSVIINNFSDNSPWIVYKFRKSQAKKIQDSKVIETFNYGLKDIKVEEYDFISKIDADIELRENYFEDISQVFATNINVGICGGVIAEKKNKEWFVV
jgi:glycosyltransferase involved in cell wall biosynthesis